MAKQKSKPTEKPQEKSPVIPPSGPAYGPPIQGTAYVAPAPQPMASALQFGRPMEQDNLQTPVVFPTPTEHIPAPVKKAAPSDPLAGIALPPPQVFPDKLVEKLKAYEPYIAKASKDYGVPAELVRAQIIKESSVNPKASNGSHFGLMQISSGIASGGDPYNPAFNIDRGTKYLSEHLKKYGAPEIALSAYNAGPGVVADYQRGTNRTGRNPKLIKNSGIPTNLNETMAYIASIRDWMPRLKNKPAVD